MSSLLEEPAPQRNAQQPAVVGPSSKSYGKLIKGLQTDLVITRYTNRTLIILTQLRKLGTVLEIQRDTARNPAEGSSGRAVYTITTLLGQESEELHLFARILAEKLKVIKPVLLTVAVKNLDQAKIKDLVAFVTEKYSV